MGINAAEAIGALGTVAIPSGIPAAETTEYVTRSNKGLRTIQPSVSAVDHVRSARCYCLKGAPLDHDAGAR